jgi:hypothetical protein
MEGAKGILIVVDNNVGTPRNRSLDKQEQPLTHAQGHSALRVQSVPPRLPTARAKPHWAPTRAPPYYATRIMAHVLPPGGERSLHRGGGPCPGLTDQDNRLAVRNARGIELRERMIDGARDVSAGVGF